MSHRKGDVFFCPLLILLCQVIFKSLFDSRHHIGSRGLERHEEPQRVKVNESGQIRVYHRKSKKPQKVVDDLYSTEDGKASEKAHGAPYQTQLGLYCHLQILG